MKACALLAPWLAVTALACGSSDTERNPYVATPGIDAGRDSTPRNDAPTTDGSQGEASADGGVDTGSGDAKVADVFVPDVLPDAGPSTCAAGFSVMNRALLGISTSAADHFGSISDDELTLAFGVEDGAAMKVLVAERAQVDDPFDAPVELAGDFALDRATLTPDGLSLIAVSADRRGFARFAREARDQAFELAASSHYDAIVAGLGAGENLGDPVFALGGQVLFFSVYGGSSVNTVRFATRLSLGSAFDMGGELTNQELVAQGSKRRRPTGVSADYTTLFFFDEVSGTAKAGTFAGGFDFRAVNDLGAVGGVQPNRDCSVFYFDAPGAAARDLFSAR